MAKIREISVIGLYDINFLFIIVDVLAGVAEW